MAVGTYALTSLANLQSYLGVSSGSDDTIQEKCIDRATAAIERHIGRNIMSRAYVLWLDCRGTGRLRLPHYPVVSLNFVGYGARDAIAVSSDSSAADIETCVSVEPKASSLVAVTVRVARVASTGAAASSTVDGATYDATSEVATQLDAVTGVVATSMEDHASKHLHRFGPVNLVGTGTCYMTVPDRNAVEWLCDHDRGMLDIVRLQRYWPEDGHGGKLPAAWQSVCVDYTGGYATVPDDVEQACLRAAAFLYRNRKRDEGVSSESLGDYSYTLRDTGTLKSMLDDDLAGWKEIR